MKRNYLFDNLKALLIVLVTVVHLLAPVRKNLGTDSIVLDLFMLTACAFHMPLFAYISGYFSKNLKNGKRKANTLISYFIMQSILVVFNLVCFGTKPRLYALLVPRFSMWYIFALFVWRCVLQRALKVKHILAWSVLLNILPMCMPIDGEVSKTFVKILNFFVFFLLGYSTDESAVNRIRNGNKYVYGIMLLASIGSIFLIVESGIISANTLRLMMLRGVTVSSKMGYLKGYLLYAYLFILPIMISIPLIGLFPEVKNRLSHWGKNTMTIYLGQALVYLLWYKRIAKWDVFQSPYTAYPTAILLSFLCCTFFGWQKTADVFNGLCDKVIHFIFRDKKAQ